MHLHISQCECSMNRDEGKMKGDGTSTQEESNDSETVLIDEEKPVEESKDGTDDIAMDGLPSLNQETDTANLRAGGVEGEKEVTDGELDSENESETMSESDIGQNPVDNDDNLVPEDYTLQMVKTEAAVSDKKASLISR